MLIALELILGIDKIIFISVLTDKLPPEKRNKLRFWGLGLAVVMRLGLLAGIAWILRLDKTLFTIFENQFLRQSNHTHFGWDILDMEKHQGNLPQNRIGNQ